MKYQSKKMLNKIMKILVNGETKKFEKELNLSELLNELDLPSKLIAIELNKNVVRKKDWEEIKLSDEDKIEIVHFVGGG